MPFGLDAAMPKQKVSSVELLSVEKVVSELETTIAEVSEILPLSAPVLRALLYQAKWSKMVLLESYYADPELVFKQAGLMDPDIVQVYEQQASDECGICMEPYDTVGFLTGECGHSFCRDCWQEYVSEKVNTGSILRLECPASTCSSLLADSTLYSILKPCPSTHSRYSSLLASSTVERTPGLAWCPGASCGGILRLLEDTHRETVVRCPCGHKFCFGCGRAEHYTVPCLLVESWENQEFAENIQMKFVVILSKKCPKCRVDTEKVGGCKFMNCGKCRAEFCWECLALTPRHNHGATPCSPQEEAAGTSRTVEAEDDGLNERDRFSLFQQKYKSLEANQGFLLLDSKERQRLHSLLSISPTTIFEVEGKVEEDIPENTDGLRDQGAVFEELLFLRRRAAMLEDLPARQQGAVNPPLPDELEDVGGWEGEMEREREAGMVLAGVERELRERRLRMRFMMRRPAARSTLPRSHLVLHMKEWLRPYGATQARARLRPVVAALEDCIKRHSGLDWVSLTYLTSAAAGLEEAQRVAMYAQVFAFYLGCVPRMEPGEKTEWVARNRRQISGFRGRLYSENNPRSLDAEMFYVNLERLEESLHSLSNELMVVVEASLLIRLWMEGHQAEVKVSYGNWDLELAQFTIQQQRSEVMNRVSMCQQRKEAIVTLMEEGFGERMWAFRAVRA